MNEKVRALLNQQINKEFYSAYLYLDFSNYYERAGLNGFGDLLLLISLMHLDASVQYTFVTGGTIIVSSLIALCQRVKLRPKEWIATGIALAATLFLL